MPQSPHVCLTLFCVLDTRVGRQEGKEDTQCPGEAGITGAALCVCACMIGFRWVIAHPGKPGVRNRELSEIDAHFYEVWLSWGFWQISCSLSKARRMASKSPGPVPPCCSGGAFGCALHHMSR